VAFKNQNGKVTFGDLASLMMKLKSFVDMYREDEIKGILNETDNDFTNDVDFEAFLRVSNFMVFTLSFFDINCGEFFGAHIIWICIGILLKWIILIGSLIVFINF
jgi:hypothetical protein